MPDVAEATKETHVPSRENPYAVKLLERRDLTTAISSKLTVPHDHRHGWAGNGERAITVFFYTGAEL